MDTKVIKIGTSRGVIIPEKVLSRLEIQEGDILDYKIDESKCQIVLIKKKEIRQNWKKSFELMATNHDDELIFVKKDKKT